ncbi:MAG: type III-B CRISPR module-associated protein Cmr5 [Promethearchaeota archaeon]
MNINKVLSLRSLNQERAQYSYECIKNFKTIVKNDNDKKNYLSYVRKTPTLIQTNGLTNTMLFYKTKKDNFAYTQLYNHINRWFNKQYELNKDIVDWAIESNTSQIMIFRATREILEMLNWLKRFAEVELGD